MPFNPPSKGWPRGTPPVNGWWRASWNMEYLFVDSVARFVVQRHGKTSEYEALTGKGNASGFKELTITPFARGYRKELKIICEVAAKLGR